MEQFLSAWLMKATGLNHQALSERWLRSLRIQDNSCWIAPVQEKAMAIRPERAHHCFMSQELRLLLSPLDARGRS